MPGIFKKKPPQILVISPPYIDESNPYIAEKCIGGEAKSKELAIYYKEVADKEQTAFMDLGPLIPPSKVDGGHLDSESHGKIAELLAVKIKELCK